MKQIISHTPKPDAYAEVDTAIARLIELAWERWHPKNPETRGKAPRIVCAALRDVRAVAHELEALWIHLGNTRLGLDRELPERDVDYDDALEAIDEDDEADDEPVIGLMPPRSACEPHRVFEFGSADYEPFTEEPAYAVEDGPDLDPELL